MKTWLDLRTTPRCIAGRRWLQGSLSEMMLAKLQKTSQNRRRMTQVIPQLVTCLQDQACPAWQCPARVDIGSSRSEKWNENLVHSFREVKSEIKIWFTYFENEKWNENASSSRSRMKSEMEIPQNRDREWKVKWKCLEIEIEKWNFSRIFEKFLRIKKSRKFKILLQILFI